MIGYARKTLAISHDASRPVRFTIEVDPLADGTWLPYSTITVPPGKSVQHAFPPGFAAHWVRFKADARCRATATLRYE